MALSAVSTTFLYSSNPKYASAIRLRHSAHFFSRISLARLKLFSASSNCDFRSSMRPLLISTSAVSIWSVAPNADPNKIKRQRITFTIVGFLRGAASYHRKHFVVARFRRIMCAVHLTSGRSGKSTDSHIRRLCMKSPKQIAVIVFMVLSFLLSPVTLLAQTGTNDWSRLGSVAGGTKLSVKLKDGQKIDGKLANVSDASLSLTVKNAAKEIRREDVATVHQVSKKGAGKATLIGLGVGAGAGTAIAVAGDANSDGFGEVHNGVTAGFVVLVAGVGALAGYLIGRIGNKRVLLYESK